MEDKLLVKQCKRGSKEALRRIYEKYKDYLLILAVGLVNNSSIAEDVVHDVFTGFVRDINKFRLTGSLKGYLGTCVANRARNINKAKHHISFESNPVELNESELNEPASTIVCNEQLQQLNAALAELPYDQREVIMLHFQAGLTFQQIGQEQVISVNTIKSRYKYGIDKLRTILDGELKK
ncbi:MAG: sigma-70 family RNA polymerase sigma factor [Sedimentisphaerales bacterium]|nr:sigma-70 family RNA polymerase sigma factor [Sedimentisphaerales bacterium]